MPEFCSHGPLAIQVEIWQRDEDPPRKINAYGYPYPGSGALKRSPRIHAVGLAAGLNFAAGVENAPGKAGHSC